MKNNETLTGCEIECITYHDTKSKVMLQDFGYGVEIIVYFEQNIVGILVDNELKSKHINLTIAEFMKLQCEVKAISEQRRIESDIYNATKENMHNK